MRIQPRAGPRLIALASLALFTVACADDQPTAPLPESPNFAVASGGSEATPTDNHVVVMSRRIPRGFADKVAALGGTVLRTHPEIGVAVTNGLTDAAAAELAGSPGVSGIDRDLLVQWIPSAEEMMGEQLEGPSGETDQSGAGFFPFFQWNMRQIAADVAWTSTAQGLGATVAILDTGGDPFHQDLAGEILGSSTSVLTAGSSPCGAFDETTIFDLNFHGSFVSGIVSSNGIGMASVAPDAKLLIVKVLNCGGSGLFGDVIAGIVFAANAGADVINMSLGAYFPKNLPTAGQLVAALNRATNFANRSGVLVVASAGNGNPITGLGINLDKDKNFTHVPSQSANVLSVGATAPFNQANFDKLATYTNFGVSGVDVMGPGGNLPFADIRDLVLSVCSVFVCGPPNAYVLSAGTSFAAPHAAGTAAVVESDLAGNQNAAKLERCVINGADDLGKKGTDGQYSFGRINVVGAAACR